MVTDPPYGLKFMGKKWDYDVPSVAIWNEILRVLKPGGHLLSFGGTRTYHRMCTAIEDSGFEIRDQIQWLYGSGFPKSHNIGDGIGTALKPANEPIVLARKPLEKGLTVAKNVEKYGTGGLNIDESRIGTTVETWPKSRSFQSGISSGFTSGLGAGETQSTGPVPQGRWPANVILDEVAAEMLDEMSGPCKTGVITNPPRIKDGFFSGKKPAVTASHVDTATGASRFFYVAKASKRERNAGLEGLPKREAGALNMRTDSHSKRNGETTLPASNHHPTVKPIKLMQYLIKLVTPKGGTVLDPFMGSGSTGIACKKLGFKFIGIEMNQEYVEIAEKRIANAV